MEQLNTQRELNYGLCNSDAQKNDNNPGENDLPRE